MKLDIKMKIEGIVLDYIHLFPLEFEAIKKIVKEKRDKQITKFGEMKQSGLVERATGEYPETLDGMLRQRLTNDELLELQTKEGMRWFYLKFKEFSLTQ